MHCVESERVPRLETLVQVVEGNRFVGVGSRHGGLHGVGICFRRQREQIGHNTLAGQGNITVVTCPRSNDLFSVIGNRAGIALTLPVQELNRLARLHVVDDLTVLIFTDCIDQNRVGLVIVDSVFACLLFGLHRGREATKEVHAGFSELFLGRVTSFDFALDGLVVGSELRFDDFGRGIVGEFCIQLFGGNQTLNAREFGFQSEGCLVSFVGCCVELNSNLAQHTTVSKTKELGRGGSTANPNVKPSDAQIEAEQKALNAALTAKLRPEQKNQAINTTIALKDFVRRGDDGMYILIAADPRLDLDDLNQLVVSGQARHR